MKQVLMCYPEYFDVVYDINPWMTNNHENVEPNKAKDQWNLLYAMIRSCAQVQLVMPDSQVPDLVFTANAGFYFADHQNEHNVILSRFKHAERQFEEVIFYTHFEKEGYKVHTVQESFEGQGDLLEDSEGRLWCGTGFRTNGAVIPELETIVDGYIHRLVLTDPRWYHLDTCFCPLPNGELMWYPGAFDEKSQEEIRRNFNTVIDVTEEDALQFACNSVGLSNNLFIPRSSAQLENTLKGLGYAVFSFDLSEFIKSGGAAKCLVMNLNDL